MRLAIIIALTVLIASCTLMETGETTYQVRDDRGVAVVDVAYATFTPEPTSTPTPTATPIPQPATGGISVEIPGSPFTTNDTLTVTWRIIEPPPIVIFGEADVAVVTDTIRVTTPVTFYVPGHHVLGVTACNQDGLCTGGELPVDVP